LARLLAREAAGHLPDSELLELYCRQRDEGAFAVLVARYGPLVLGVCRRVLGDRHDAEDAFQATFLVLARRAATIRNTASLGNWLHGVAVRLARQAKRLAARRRCRERDQAAGHPCNGGGTCPEALQALDEEIQRLPDAFRAPLVLCYLTGLTQQQAAKQLGLSFGTLRRRLAQGRARLRHRLLSRGLAPAALLAATADAAQAIVPQTLAGSTVRAALGGAVSFSVRTLTKKGLQTMLLTKTKYGLALVLAVSLGAGLVVHQGLPAQPPAPVKPGYAADKAPLNYGPPADSNARSPATAPDIDQRLANLELRLEGALREVKEIRHALKTASTGAPPKPTPIRLKSARAARAAEVLRAAFPEGQLRITCDDQTNTVFVQAGPAHLRAAQRLLQALDGEQEGASEKPSSQYLNNVRKF
jgi:RNA polymerase sigma-70 factor (ECF subfamily)